MIFFFLISWELIDSIEAQVEKWMLHNVGPLKQRLIDVYCMNLNIYGSSKNICKPNELHFCFMYVEPKLH